MGWVSQSSYIFGWGNGGAPGPGTSPEPAPEPPEEAFSAETDEQE